MPFTQKTAAPEHTVSRQPAAQPSIGDFLSLMGELRDILAAENDFLRQGLPAGLSQLQDDKKRLAEEYDRQTQFILAQRTREIVDNPDVFARIVASGREVQALATENMERLDAAMAATRMRIEAVMTAIRSQRAQNQTYGSRGQRQGGQYQGGQYQSAPIAVLPNAPGVGPEAGPGAQGGINYVPGNYLKV